MNTVTLNMKGLQRVKRRLNMRGYQNDQASKVEVGVFAKNASRSPSKEGLNNAEVGAKQEFGSASEGIPRRSFLIDPLVLGLGESVKRNNPELLTALLDEGVKPFLSDLGELAQGVIQEGFDTAGFGGWAPNAPMTVFLKGSDKPLIDTKQLRESIDSRVKMK